MLCVVFFEEMSNTTEKKIYFYNEFGFVYAEIGRERERTVGKLPTSLLEF